MIGGSGYMGKALVEQLLAAGDTVLVLNRGRTPDTFGDRVQRLKADRDDRAGFRAALGEAGELDAAIDFTAYEAHHVSDVVLVLAGKVRHYVFISTNSVCEPSPPPLISPGTLAVSRQQSDRRSAAPVA